MYIVSPASMCLLLPVNALPPLEAAYRSKSATGVAVYSVMKLSFVVLAVLPSPEPLTLNAVTVTLYGELVLSVYVWLGVLSDVAVVVWPSPHAIVYLFALPTTLVDNVTLKGLPPEVTLVENQHS